jgi:L-lactate utilization protein LutB
MSSDGDYTDIVKKIVGNKKRKAIVVGKANASKKLQDTSTLFLDWDV